MSIGKDGGAESGQGHWAGARPHSVGLRNSRLTAWASAKMAGQSVDKFNGQELAHTAWVFATVGWQHEH